MIHVFGSNDNYPPGAANDPNAPYNQKDIEPIEVEIEYSCVMRRITDVETTRYTAYHWEDCEPDGEGGYDRTGGIEYEFDDNDFRDEYEEQRFNPSELIDELKSIVTMLINGDEVTVSKAKLRQILEDCEGWEIEDEDCGKA